ncbi:MAG: TetR/AcrR family transcriptional regulator [Desertimonas sp.]
MEPEAHDTPTPVTRGLNRTRDALIAAAIRVFDRVPFADATITSIANEASVAHGSFYTYFDSKEAVLREAVAQLQQRGPLRPGDQPTPGTIEERIRHGNQQFFEYYASHTRLFSSFEELASRDPATADLRRHTRRQYIARTPQAIKGWQEEGLVDAEGQGHERMQDVIHRIWTSALGLRGA